MRLILGSLMLILVSCSGEKIPSGIIAPVNMKKIMFDLMKADNYVNNYVLKDTTLTSKQQHFKYYQQVFTIHKTDKKTFYNSLTYYQQHPDINKALFDSILTYANRERDVMYKQLHKLPADTINPK